MNTSMKRFAGLLASSLFIFLWLPLAAFAGENIVYDGSNTGLLATDPITGLVNSLFPATSLSGNTVRVTDGTVAGRAYGGVTNSAADVSNNSLAITGNGKVDRDVYGGYSDSGDVTGNTAMVSGTGTVGRDVLGGYSYSGDVTGNTATVSGTVGWSVFGGYSDSGDVTGNTATVSGGTVDKDVFGGYSVSSDVTGNTATVSGGTVGKDVIGGYSKDSTVTGNTATVSGTGTVEGYVYGGYSNFGTSVGNTATVSGGMVNGHVYGGSSDSGAATGNTATVSGGEVGRDVYGGSSDTSIATGNTATVSGGMVWGDVYGGSSDTSIATGNTAMVSGGMVWGDVYGGKSDSGTATGNTSTVSGGTVTQSIYGGKSDSGTVTGNTATVSGGTVTQFVYGGYSLSGTAMDNMVIVSDGTVDGDVYGGYSNDGAVTGNTATISGGTVGREDVYGGYSVDGAVTGNTVMVSGGTVARDVYGGRSDSGIVTGNTVTVSSGSVGHYVYGGYSVGDIVTGNMVTVSGGTVDGDVSGGYSNTATATGNSVILSGSPTFSAANTTIYGGNGGGVGDYFTGNSLEVLNPMSSSVKEVKNFQYYQFLLPAAAGGAPMLTAADIDLTDGASRTATVNHLGIVGGGSLPVAGNSYVLLDATNTMTGPYVANTVGAMKGISMLYDMNVAQSGNQLIATVAKAGRVNPQINALAEGRISGLAFVNQGADLIAGPGLASALAATHLDAAVGKKRLLGFGAFSGGSSRYNSGSHTDVDGFLLITGLGWRPLLAQNSLLLGVFFEMGRGSYDSYNNFSNLASIRGNGDTEYYGGGIMARYEFTEGSLAGLYTDASLRVGHTSTDFSSNDLQNSLGRIHTSYDSGATYYGVHAGLGYIWQLSEVASFDFSSKYLWTHQGSDSVTVAGDTINFKTADSHRFRNGARFSYVVDTESGAQFIPYIGAAYDYEFDGKAGASVYGQGIKDPSLKGGTGIGDLGLNFKPAVNSNFSMGLGVQGYVGVREGVSGNLQFKYEF